MTQASFISTARAGRLRAITGLARSQFDRRASANASPRRSVAPARIIDRLIADYDNIVFLNHAQGLPHPQSA
jgi:hypothetical protein